MRWPEIEPGSANHRTKKQCAQAEQSNTNCICTGGEDTQKCGDGTAVNIAWSNDKVQSTCYCTQDINNETNNASPCCQDDEASTTPGMGWHSIGLCLFNSLIAFLHKYRLICIFCLFFFCLCLLLLTHNFLCHNNPVE